MTRRVIITLVPLVSSLRSRIAIIWDAGYYGGGGFLVDPFLGIGVNRFANHQGLQQARQVRSFAALCCERVLFASASPMSSVWPTIVTLSVGLAFKASATCFRT